MQNRFAILIIAGFTVLGIVVSAAAALAPAPSEPPSFFSTVAPANTTSSQAVAAVVPTETATALPTVQPTAQPTAAIARPSNPGGTGPAAALKGNAAAGQVVFETNCVKCHGQEGKGGIANPGSDDGTVPALNPIDDTLVSQDYGTYAGNLDLFLEHGSTPSGPSPVLSMPNWGDAGKLKPQQIADVMAYVISLNPAPSASSAQIARPSNPGGTGPAAALKGNAAAGQVVFETNCVKCHGQEGKGGIANPGSDDGTVPALNPIDDTLVSQDYGTYAGNLDLFLEHGSTPSGPSPVLSMPNWGDSGKLKPQQIADVMAYVMSLNPAPSTSSSQIARPSNPGGTGPAATLKGNATAGQVVFQANCVKCHGQEGKGGVANPGSDDGTVPALNPIDDTLVSQDYGTYAGNLDLFLEHGSTPSGPSPVLSMPNWGDSGKLTPQQIADVMAYVISLNK